MVTSAADFSDLQTKPNQTMHIYPYILYLFDNPTPRTMQCTVGENSHFSVTSQNIFSQSQKYFDTSIIYFLKNIWLQSNLQFSSKLEMSISFK